MVLILNIIFETYELILYDFIRKHREIYRKSTVSVILGDIGPDFPLIYVRHSGDIFGTKIDLPPETFVSGGCIRSPSTLLA